MVAKKLMVVMTILIVKIYDKKLHLKIMHGK